MKYYLIKMSADYADEFDVKAFIICNETDYLKNRKKTEDILDTFFEVGNVTEEQFDKISSYNKYIEYPSKENKHGVIVTYEQYLKEPDKWNHKFRRKEYELGFGTNESLTFYSKEDYFSNLNIQEITEEEYLIIKKLFGTSFGTCSHFFPIYD